MRVSNRTELPAGFTLALAVLLLGSIWSLQVADTISPPAPIRYYMQQQSASADKSHQSPTSGQLESFSVESTGLGDQEGSSAWKKMNKRDWSVKIGQPLVDLSNAEARGLHNKADLKASRDDERTSGQQSAAKLDARPPIFAIETPNPSELRPILIARRTAEMLNPRDPSEVSSREPQVSSAYQVRQLAESALRNSIPAEFGSRLSFITTRKMEPDELAIRQHLYALKQPENNSPVVALMDLDSNHLPRVARAQFM